MKKVAIITRTKDREILLKRAKDSICNQTFQDFVWVIVNDGGKKKPIDNVVMEATSDGIHVVGLHNEESMGMEAASNKGIQNSQSDYIIIHDDDDSWDRLFLEKTVRFLESELGALYGGVVTHSTKVEEAVFDNSYKILSTSPFNFWLSQVYLMDVAKTNSFPPISFLYRREIYDKIGGYDETLPVLGDWDFNLRFLIEADIAVIHEPLALYHHRVKSDNKGYENTVVHGIDNHKKYDAIIRNRYFRKDIKSNSIGLGFIVNFARDLNMISQFHNLIINFLKKNKLAKILMRFIKR